MSQAEPIFRTHGAEVVIGEKCGLGHTMRYVNGGGCVQCHLNWAAEQRLRVKKNGITALAEAKKEIRALRREIRLLKADG